MRQLHFAMLDLELHARFKPGGKETVFDVDHRIAEKTMVMPPLPEDRYPTAALHALHLPAHSHIQNPSAPPFAPPHCAPPSPPPPAFHTASPSLPFTCLFLVSLACLLLAQVRMTCSH